MLIPCSCGICVVCLLPISPIIPLSLVTSPLSGLLPLSSTSPFLCWGHLLDAVSLRWPRPSASLGSTSCSWEVDVSFAPSSSLFSCFHQSLSSTKKSLLWLFLPITFNFFYFFPHMFTSLTVSGFLIVRSCLQHVALLTIPSCLPFSFSFGYHDTSFPFLIFLRSGQCLPVSKLVSRFPLLPVSLFPLTVASGYLVLSFCTLIPYTLLWGDWSPFML